MSLGLNNKSLITRIQEHNSTVLPVPIDMQQEGLSGRNSFRIHDVLHRRPTLTEAFETILIELDRYSTTTVVGVRLLLDWAEMERRIRAHIAECKKDKEEELRRELSRAQADGRNAKDKLEELEAEHSALRGQMPLLLDELSKAKLAVKLNTPPHEDDFPTREEIMEWEIEHKRMSGTVEQRQQVVDAQQARIDIKAGEITRTQQQLAELKARRANIKDQLAGRPPRGPLGLAGTTVDYNR